MKKIIVFIGCFLFTLPLYSKEQFRVEVVHKKNKSEKVVYAVEKKEGQYSILKWKGKDGKRAKAKSRKLGIRKFRQIEIVAGEIVILDDSKPKLNKCDVVGEVTLSPIKKSATVCTQFETQKEKFENLKRVLQDPFNR